MCKQMSFNILFKNKVTNKLFAFELHKHPTLTHIYIYIHVCVCVCGWVCVRKLFGIR